MKMYNLSMNTKTQIPKYTQIPNILDREVVTVNITEFDDIIE